MRLIKFIQIMIILTGLALVYISMQMQIYDLAYKAKKKEKEIHKVLDENGNLIYAILSLKSANHLGEKLLTENSDLKFLEKDKIVQLEDKSFKRKSSPAVTPPKAQKKLTNMLISLFSLKSQAEAKPIE